MRDATPLLRAWARRRLRRLARMDARETQRAVLRALVRRARRTRFGRDHDFARVRGLDDYRARVPMRDWEAFWDSYWRAPFPRLHGVTWPGRVPVDRAVVGDVARGRPNTSP